MSTVFDATVYATAIKGAIKAQLGPNDVYDYGRVPGDLSNPIEAERAMPIPSIFVLVSIERRYNPNLRLTAQAGSTGWRIGIRAAGRSVNEARWAMHRVAVALNEKHLTVAGGLTTPIQFESDEAPRFDDGRFVGSALYVFAH